MYLQGSFLCVCHNTDFQVKVNLYIMFLKSEKLHIWEYKSLHHTNGKINFDNLNSEK